MLSTMIDFERALDIPSLHFCSLRNMRCRFVGGRPVVRRTYFAAEAEVEWNGGRYLLYMPFRRELVAHIEALEMALDGVDAPFLCRHRILYNEMLEPGGVADRRADVILQELPEGEWLKASHISSAEVSYRLSLLQEQIRSVGFSHNNLSPANIFVDRDGVFRLVRYWYASLSPESRDDIFATNVVYAEEKSPLRQLEDVASSYKADAEPLYSRLRDGMARFVVGGKVGFRDEEGEVVIPPTYSYATDFEEGRAVVADESMKMGAIDKSGRTVVPLLYDDILFDVGQACFSAYKGDLLYRIDYCGEILSTTPIEPASQRHTEVLGTDDGFRR